MIFFFKAQGNCTDDIICNKCSANVVEVCVQILIFCL